MSAGSWPLEAASSTTAAAPSPSRSSRQPAGMTKLDGDGQSSEPLADALEHVRRMRGGANPRWKLHHDRADLSCRVKRLDPGAKGSPDLVANLARQFLGVHTRLA